MCPPMPPGPWFLQDGAITLSSLALIATARGGASGPLAGSPLFGLLVVLAMVEKLVSPQTYVGHIASVRSCGAQKGRGGMASQAALAPRHAAQTHLLACPPCAAGLHFLGAGH